MAKYGQMRRNKIEATYKPGMVGATGIKKVQWLYCDAAIDIGLRPGMNSKQIAMIWPRL